MYDFSSHHVNNRDKVLREITAMSMLLEIGLAAYQRVGVNVLAFRIPSETQTLQDSGGEWEPVVVANRPTICEELMGLNACGI